MFEDLYNALSYLWSWNWPTAQGQVTEVIIERITHTRNAKTVRLSVTYKFFVGTDGPYTGESFWSPAYCGNQRVIAARRKIRMRQPMQVHYRSDDPSVNRLSRSVWQGL